MTDHRLNRSVLIRARRATVFRYFTDPERFAAWWGEGSTIEGRPGGEVRIVYPGGSTASGNVVELAVEERIVFTFGYDDPSKPIAPGGSTVTVRLEDHPLGTLLHLEHAVADEATRDMHVPGWRYQLAVFANVAAAEEHAGLDERLDRWFALWANPDADERAAELARLATEDVTFKDAFACVEGRDELNAHVSAAQAHGGGAVLERAGPCRQCQGTALVDWQARGPDGAVQLRGSNVIELAADGRVRSVCGLWALPSP